MNILLVAATLAEIEPLISSLKIDYDKPATVGNHILTTLITGVGMVATAYALGRHLAENQYDLAINAGIAGTFDFNIAPGEVVLITEDIFAEQGAEDGENFISLKALGYGEISHFPNAIILQLGSNVSNIANSIALKKLKNVKAITVNKVHGHELSIAKTLLRFDAQVESMEGAAFFYACNKSNTPCIQIRSISNYVERRNMENWNIALAIKNLNHQLIELLTS